MKNSNKYMGKIKKYLNRRTSLILAFIIGLILTVISGGDNNSDIFDNERMQESISSKIIRFHVVANSDEECDQNLKLKVKEEVVRFVTPYLENAKDVNESRSILKSLDGEIEKVARNVVEEEGYTYDVKAYMDYTYFPAKAYSDVMLPPGNYEAYEVKIGEARGRNWWCIMYPPLCLVDVTHAAMSEKSKELLKNILDEDEYDMVTESKPAYKIKLFELLGK